MADKFMYICNDNTKTYPFCRLQSVVKRLDTQPSEPANQDLIKVFKVIKPTSK